MKQSQVHLQMPRGEALSGRITDNQGNSIAGAKVTSGVEKFDAWTEGGPPRLRPQGNGNAAIAFMGPCDIRVEHPRFETTTSSITHIPGHFGITMKK